MSLAFYGIDRHKNQVFMDNIFFNTILCEPSYTGSAKVRNDVLIKFPLGFFFKLYLGSVNIETQTVLWLQFSTWLRTRRTFLRCIENICPGNDRHGLLNEKKRILYLLSLCKIVSIFRVSSRRLQCIISHKIVRCFTLEKSLTMRWVRR